MSISTPKKDRLIIRRLQYRDLEGIENLAASCCEVDWYSCSVSLGRQLQQVRRWYGLLKFLSWFPNPLEHHFCVYVAELDGEIVGCIQVSPFNKARTTWRVERVLEEIKNPRLKLTSPNTDVGSQLLRYCFESIWEARTWVLEVNVHQKKSLALYRQNGFQSLAQITYWAIAPNILEELAQHDRDLPNLLPANNADAKLLYQLDCVSMPPLLRQVFDRHIQDFQTSILNSSIIQLKRWFTQKQVAKGYVFEPQRKAAIGYFELELCKDGSQPHQAKLTVHPAYTWLYPKLLAKMASIVGELPPQSLRLVSADYQPEREEYLEQLGASRIEHALLMSRSVWHKLRETKPLEKLQLSEVLKGLQPARTPIPSRMSWLKSPKVQTPKTPARQEISESKPNAKSHNSKPEDNNKTIKPNDNHP